jgi:hypothetical protein
MRAEFKLATPFLAAALFLTGFVLFATQSASPPIVYRQEHTEKHTHLCGYPLKNGKTCTRKVADNKGQYCFQHRKQAK